MALLACALVWLGGCGAPAVRHERVTLLADSLLSRRPGEEVRLLRLRDRRGVVHEAWLRLVPAPIPGVTRYQPVVILGGVGTGRRAAEIVPCPPGFAIVGLDYPYRGPRAPTREELLRHAPDIVSAAHRTPGGVAAAVEYLSGRADMSGQGALVIGASFGVPFVARGLAELPRARDTQGRDLGPAGVRAVALLFGGADLPAMVRYRMREAPTWERETAAFLVGLLFSDLEPSRWVGRIAPRPLLLVQGTDDEFVSRRSAETLAAAAGEPKMTIWLDSRHLQPDAFDLLRELVVRTLGWLAGLGV